jgi:peptidyl-prolyl cis-trans isomerase C
MTHMNSRVHRSLFSRHHIRRRSGVLALLLLGLLMLAGCAPPADLVAAARVNGQAIALQHYLRFVQINKSLCQFQDQLTGGINAAIDWNDPARRDDLAAVRRMSLDQLINAELTDEQAAAHHISVDPQAVDQLLAASQRQGVFPPNDLLPSLHITQDDLRLLARQALEQQQLLRLMPDLTTADAQVNAIQVNDRATAEQVLAQLQAGVSFADLAAKYSQSRTRGTGGDAGDFTPGAAPAALDQVFFSAPIGQPVGPVAVQQPANRLCFANAPGVEPPLSAQQGPTLYYVVEVRSRQTVPLLNVDNAPNDAQNVVFTRWLRQHATVQVLVDF